MHLILLFLLLGAPDEGAPTKDAAKEIAASPTTDQAATANDADKLSQVLGQITADHPKADRLAALARPRR